VSDRLTEQVRAVMEDASRRAIMPRYRSLSAGEIENKATDDVVTVADHESEAILTEGLAKILPEANVVGEEAAEDDPAIMDRLGLGLCWIVDPLDGTNNFAAGKPPFGVLVALADGGETIAGWIYDCQSDRFCHAGRGKGAFVDGDRVTARTSEQSPPVAAISTIFLDAAERKAVREHIAPHYRLVDIPRCAAEQYPRLALGENDVSLFNRTLPWDHAAGALWLEEAGGKVARLDGSEYRPDDWQRAGLIGAASHELWNELAERVAAMG